MIRLDPRAIFRMLARDIPASLRRHVYVVGSLAAAYHHRASLYRRAVNTKDADVIVHPAGAVRSVAQMARRLLESGWARTDQCFPQPAARPAARLRTMRLHPAGSTAYFLELLGLPPRTQPGPVVWTPVRLADGWYGVPCFRFLALTAGDRLRSAEGIDYAHPAMMALANLLAHPNVGVQRMSGWIGGRPILRAAKDLGRMLALAWLGGREETQGWPRLWRAGLRRCFPAQWRALARRPGHGLRELLDDPVALEEAWFTTNVGLLSGKGVTPENLRVVGEELLADAMEPLRRL